jgi:secreted trypsin-like serine protease
MMVSLITGAGLLLTGTPLAAAAPADDTPHTNIVGGQDPTENYPFIVAFLNPHPTTGKTVAYCGGALLAPNWIVSAGHCGMEFHAGITQARVGSNRWAEGGTLANITDIVQYPAWDYNTPGNDLTLIRLDRNVTEQPIKVARTPGKVGTKERVLGYGATCDLGSPEWPCYPAGLQQATLRLVPDSGCNWYDKSVELCAAGDDGQSACFADSGGPLMRPHTVYDRKGTKKTEWLLVGVVSRDGDADADTNPTCTGSTDVFTDVTKYTDWINRTITRDGYKLSQSQEAYELAG